MMWLELLATLAIKFPKLAKFFGVLAEVVHDILDGRKARKARDAKLREIDLRAEAERDDLVVDERTLRLADRVREWGRRAAERRAEESADRGVGP